MKSWYGAVKAGRTQSAKPASECRNGVLSLSPSKTTFHSSSMLKEKQGEAARNESKSQLDFYSDSSGKLLKGVK